MILSSYNDERPMGHTINAEMEMARQYVSNQAFYMVIPEPLRQYYLRFVRHYFWWYDGYVPFFHTSTTGILPTKLARTIARRLADVVSGSKLLFDDEDSPDKEFVDFKGEKKLNSLDFIERWAKHGKLDNKIRQGIEWLVVGGDSLLKLDNVQGDLQPKILRKDEYYFSTDFSGRVDNVVMYLYERIDTTKEVERQYYLIEERRYNPNTGKPEWRVHVKMGTGAKPTYKDVQPVDLADVKIDQLPDNVRREFRRNFPKCMIGQWKELPLRDLGVYLLKSTEKVSFIPSLPFGESLLDIILSLLYTYDYYYNYFNTDMFLGKGRVLVPDLWQNPANGSPLSETIYTKLPYQNGEQQSPISIQFDLRADDWIQTRNNILQQICMELGINERTLLSSIVPASEKPSAHEVSSDENNTTLFVENMRSLIKPEIDKMLEEVLYFYGVEDEKVFVKFSKLGLTNIVNIVNVVATLKDRNLIDDLTALEMIFTDKNNRQIRVIRDRIKKEKKEQEESEFKRNEQKDMQELDKMTYQNNIEAQKKPKE